tara:strand:+ start:154 stop:1707 length:1554 start_codon:yes stop_codon:yes gene_type:complete
MLLLNGKFWGSSIKNLQIGNILTRSLCWFSLLTLLYISQTSANERSLVVDPLETGNFPVGSSNFTINKSALNLLLSQGGDAGQLQQGANQNGQLRYIDELIAFPEDAFNFQLLVPNNAALYGESAGSLVPYAGYIFYPTILENGRPDYDVFVPPSLPRMQGENELPIFADSDEKYPLVIYSHGVGSHPTGGQIDFLSKLASHGYIVLALYHGDDRFEGTEPRRFSLRPLAINKAIDKILADPAFSQNIDQDRIGGVGESFGGATMLALMGAKNVGVDPMSVAFNFLSETVNDSRIKAAATIVPYAGAGFFSFFGTNGIGASFVDRPFMANSSNADEEVDYKKIEDVIDNISGAKYLIEYDGEPHSMSQGALADAYTWIKIFLDAYVKQEANSIEILSKIKSVSGSGSDSLVKAVEPAPPVKSVAATFLGSNLTAAGVKIAGSYYDLGLVLQTSESPFEFLLTTAVSANGEVTAGFYSDGILNIPLVQVESSYYAVQFKLTSSEPYIFTLTNAESTSP